MTTFGFLHTGDAHVAVFDRLLGAVSPGDDAVHIVDESLLADARHRGRVDHDLRTRIGRRLEALIDQGAAGMVCTCSTIGAASEEIGRTLAVGVTRVDRPMAQAAVARGGRIAVVAALESTMEPTRSLLQEVADTAARPV